jgi:hypothetical protein
VIIAYLQVPVGLRRPVMRSATDAVAPAGPLLKVAHDSENLMHGVGGPQSCAVLYTPGDIVSDIDCRDLVVIEAHTRHREVRTGDKLEVALDAFVLARRPGR